MQFMMQNYAELVKMRLSRFRECFELTVVEWSHSRKRAGETECLLRVVSLCWIGQRSKGQVQGDSALAVMMWPESVTMVWRMLRGVLVRRRSCRSLKTRVVLAVIVLNVIFLISLYRIATASGRASTTSSPVRADLALTISSVLETPLLDRLDSASVRRRNFRMLVSGGEMKRCESWTAGVPDVHMEEPQRWQIVDSGVRDTFVFSAYFDARSDADAHTHRLT